MAQAKKKVSNPKPSPALTAAAVNAYPTAANASAANKRVKFPVAKSKPSKNYATPAGAVARWANNM